MALRDRQNVMLFDVSNGKNAKENYRQSHLDGSLFIDVNTQLAEIGEDASQGGRHPLPDIQKFAETISALGITKQSHIVIYDDKNGSNAAARFWWMMKAVGHEKVQVLDGGFQAAKNIGIPVNAKPVVPVPAELYKAETWLLPVIDISGVERTLQRPDGLVIDVRDSDRYNGITEPIDLVAGHIPGAINVPFTSNLDEHGFLLPPAILRAKYLNVFKGKDVDTIVVHCGSGVTACHTLLAVAYAGLDMPSLYVGSWSEWSKSQRPVAP